MHGRPAHPPPRLAAALANPIEFERRLIPDERARIEATLKELVDEGAIGDNAIHVWPLVLDGLLVVGDAQVDRAPPLRRGAHRALPFAGACSRALIFRRPLLASERRGVNPVKAVNPIRR